MIVVFIIQLSACSRSTDESTLVPSQVTSNPTLTTIPLTDTPQPPTKTATLAPTETPTPTQIPQTSTPEPLLPENIIQINAGNIQQLQLLATLPVKEIYELAISPSGNKLATLSEPWDDRFNDYLEVWDMTNGEQILLVDKWDSPEGLFFPPDETALYASNRLYDLTQGELVSTLEAVPQAFSPDGETYTTGNYQGSPDESTVQIIDLASKKEVLFLKNPGMVMYLDFSPDGRLLTGGFQVGNHFVVKVWDIAKGNLMTDLVNFYTGLTFSPDGNLAAAGKGNQIYLFSTDGMTYLTSYGISDPYDAPNPKGFSYNGDVLTIEDSSDIRFLVPETGKELLKLPNECNMKFSPNGKFLITWCYQGDLKIWGVKP
jgi:WD40 repeat protein